MANRIILTTLFLLLLSAAVSSAARADKDFIVFDVRKTLPLGENEKIYRDYYVDIGIESGVHVGSILSVYRRIPVIDVYRNKAQGDLVVPVGHLRVIASQRTLSVCRLESLASESQIPVVQYKTVMMGDRVEIAGPNIGPAKNNTSNMGEAATESVAGSSDDSDRTPATAEADPVQPSKPAKALPKKKQLKQAKPSVKALPIPAQT